MQKLSQLATRTVTKIVRPQATPRWNGYVTLVDPEYTSSDPFIFLVHHVHNFQPGEVTGFPPHPHRGFETVTYAIEGGFYHGDSRGNKGKYENGDVQWLNTGKGVLHSEMFITDKTKKTHFNGFQLWLNLPAALKMSEPGYQMMWNKDIPVLTLKPTADEQPLEKVNSIAKNGEVWVKVITGKVNEAGSPVPVDKHTIAGYYHVKIDPKATWSHHVPKERNCLVYIMEGEGVFGGDQSKAKKPEYLTFKNDGDRIDITNTHGVTILEFVFLEGDPIKEPISQQGPFVMNTKQELREAMVDFQSGKFGEMDEPYLE